MTIRERVRRLLGAIGLGRRDEELAREMAFHRDMLEAQYRERGMDPDAARREARLAFGGDAQIAEAWRDQRGLPFLDALRQDVRYGLRMLRRAPGFTAAALTTLALGIGANTAIFSVVDAVLLRPLPFPDADRLVTIGDRNADGRSSNVGFATMVEWRERSRSFEQLALMRSSLPTLVTNGEAERLLGVRVSANYFDMMGVRPALGRPFTWDEDRPDHRFVAILSDSLWRRRFGADPSIVGRTIVLSELEFRIVGVMPPSFEPLDARRYFGTAAEIWVPLGYDLKGDSSCYSCRHLRGFGRLKTGVTVAQATAEMNAIRERMRQEHPTDFEPGSIAIVPLHSALTGSATRRRILMAAVAFVLLSRARTSRTCCSRARSRADPSWRCAPRSARIGAGSCGSC